MFQKLCLNKSYWNTDTCTEIKTCRPTQGERERGRESSAYFFSSSVKTAVCLLCLRSETGMQARAILSFLTERQGFVRSDPVKMWRNTLSIFGGPLLFCQKPCLTDHTVLSFRRSHHKHTPRGLKTHISYLHGSRWRTSCPNLHWINSQQPFGLRWMRVGSIQVSESTVGSHSLVGFSLVTAWAYSPIWIKALVIKC